MSATISMIGWDNTLLSKFQFRQLQTAMSTLFFAPDGFDFAYATPLFGTPWSVPLEFPLYQASVAWFCRITGLDMDPAGRLVSWLWFQASLPAVFLLLGSINVERAKRWIPLTLLVTSPVYLFYSRAFLIESTVFCLSVWFLAAFCRWVVGGHQAWLLAASLIGVLAAAAKPTTLMGFSIAAGIFVLAQAWFERDRGNAAGKRLLLRSVTPFVLPVLAGFLWQTFTATVRAKNPDAAMLDVMFGYFSFGDLAQRMSLGFWQTMTSSWRNVVLSEAGCVLLIFLCFVIPRAKLMVVGGLFAAFLSSQLIFSNLFLVHEYYFYSNGAFLVLALGVALGSPIRSKALPVWAVVPLTVLVAGTQLSAFDRFYLPSQRINTPLPELIAAIRTVTTPEDTIVVLGQDWDAAIPYYAQRRALMLAAGRERDPESIKASIERLPPGTVGAFVNIGHLRSDAEWVNHTMSSLGLGTVPLLLANDIVTSIWVPLDRRLAAERALPWNAYKSFDFVDLPQTVEGQTTLGLRQINQSRSFHSIAPLPIQATSSIAFSHATIENQLVLNAHAPSELILAIKRTAVAVDFGFGIHAGAYENGNATDGVEFQIVDLRTSGQEKILFQRHIDPLNKPQDRGYLQASVPLPEGSDGNIAFRVLTGPNGSASWDWAYVGPLVVR